jgi:cytochrome c peroxidase
MKPVLRAAGVACALFLTACFQVEEKAFEDPRPMEDLGWSPVEPVAPPGWPELNWPADNRFTPAKAILGRRLFFERMLSRDSTVTCTWCHAPSNAFTDKHRTPFGTGVRVQLGFRNPPTLVNIAFASVLMFEGNAATLEEQATHPLFASNEMDMTGPEIVARLRSDTLYRRLFRQAYGDVPITMTGVVKALATYQRTLISHDSPFDRWSAGDSNAFSDAQKRGAEIFFGTKANCAQCHAPPLFTDGGFHDIGLDSVPGDRGRALTTGFEGDVGRFKTPTLRNLTLTNPYMHDGRFETLEKVVEHYNAGGHPSANKDPRVRPLGLTEGEQQDLVHFLESLTDPSIVAGNEL